MRVFEVECCGGGSCSGAIVSSTSKTSWAVKAAFALVPSRPGSAKSTLSRLASFSRPDVAASAARGNNAAHLRHPPFRSDM